MTRYTKRQREQAAMICAMMASSNSQEGGTTMIDPRGVIYGLTVRPAFDISDATEVICAPADLARGAFWSIPRRDAAWDEAVRAEWAEAECLIRTGWTP